MGGRGAKSVSKREEVPRAVASTGRVKSGQGFPRLGANLLTSGRLRAP